MFNCVIWFENDMNDSLPPSIVNWKLQM